MNRLNEVHSLTTKLSVLYVEDEISYQKDMAGLLNDFFKVVDTAENGKDALEQYKEYFTNNQTHYDIVLTDINMPLIGGFELSKKILEINKAQEIIVVSAYHESSCIDQFTNIGIENFMLKPLKLENMLDVFYDVSQKVNAL